MTVKGRDRYPRAAALLEKLAGAAMRPAPAPLAEFSVGAAVFRPPPDVVRSTVKPRKLDESLEGEGVTEEILGELVDMVFVSADESTSNNAEVHLVFKAEVLGGLHMKLVRMPDGMHATFIVEDANARREVANHVDDLVAHLKGRGFSVASHHIEIAANIGTGAGGAGGAP